MNKGLFVIATIVVLLSGFFVYETMRPVASEKVSAFISIDESLDIMALEVYKDQLFVGSASGLYVLGGDKDNQRLTMYPLEKSISYIRSLMTDDQGRLWIGSAEGVIVLDRDGHEVYINKENGLLNDNRVNVIYETKNQCIWIGTWGGAVQFNSEFIVEKELTQQTGLLKDMVNAIYEDVNEGVFFASYNVRGGGVTYLNKESFRYFAEKELANINTTAMLEVDENTLWIGGGMLSEGGLSILKYIDGQWVADTILTKKDGLIGEKVRSLYMDDGTIYIGSEYDGIAVFLRNGDRIYYTQENGLNHNEVKCLKSFEGNLYFGTKQGLCFLKG